MTEIIKYGVCNNSECDKKDYHHIKPHVIFMQWIENGYNNYVGCSTCNEGDGGYCEEDIRYERKLKIQKLNNE